MRTMVTIDHEDHEVVEQPERLFGLVALAPAEQGDRAEVRGQPAAERVLQERADLRRGRWPGRSVGRVTSRPRSRGILTFEPLQGDRDQRQEVQLHVVAADRDVAVLVLQGGDELLVGEAVAVHPEALRERGAEEPVDLVDEVALQRPRERGGDDLGVGRQRVLDARVEVRGLDGLAGDVGAHGSADLGVIGHGGDDLHVGLGVEDDAVRPERERADQDGEDGGDDQEQRDACADARRAPGLQGAPDRSEGARCARRRLLARTGRSPARRRSRPVALLGRRPLAGSPAGASRSGRLLGHHDPPAFTAPPRDAPAPAPPTLARAPDDSVCALPLVPGRRSRPVAGGLGDGGGKPPCALHEAPLVVQAEGEPQAAVVAVSGEAPPGRERDAVAFGHGQQS